MIQYSIFYRVIEAKYHFKRGASSKSLMNRRHILLFVCFLILFSSCSTAKVYTKPDAFSYTREHRTLAILPPNVKIDVKNSKKVRIENHLEQEGTEAINAQNEMYSRLLKYAQKRNLYVEIQDIERTNAILSKFYYPDEYDIDMTPEEIAEVLGVDALLYSTYVYSKRKDVGIGIAYAIVFFPYGTPWGIMMAAMPTYRVDANLRLFDGQSGNMLWNYNRKIESLGGAYVNLIDVLTKKASKKTPYYRK